MLVSLSKVNKYFGERCLFRDVSFSVGENDKIGLVGRNGCGKTTLLNIITGEEPAAGDIFKNKDLKCGYLKQQINIESDKTVLGEVLTVFDHLSQTERELEEIALEIEQNDANSENLLARQQSLREFYENSGGYTYRSIARASLLGLGFDEKDLELDFNSLSGGQKTRVLLCKTLLSDSGLLLLDEPTNHLDLDSAAWLEGFLKDYRGAAIIISHDRYFLDKVTNRTFEISSSSLDVYEGNYSRHLEIKEEREKVLRRNFEKTTKEIERLEGVIEEQRRWNKEKSVKRAESKQKAVDKLKETLIAPPGKEKNIRFDLNEKNTSGNDVLILSDIAMSFSKKILFSDVNIHIRRGEKVFLAGPNGCGKTTLLKIILGELTQKSGTIKLGTNVKIGYYDQAQSSIGSGKTIFDEISDTYPKMTQTEIRNALAAFLFFGDDVFKETDTLSGGERARVLILKLMLSGANFLILDEPTNHLDIDSCEALEKALSNYGGTVLAVSHDRYFINKLTDRLLYLTESGAENYLGDYDFFLEKRAESAEVKEKKKPTGGSANYKEEKERKALLRKLKNTLSSTERKIEETEREIEKLHVAAQAPENAADYIKLSELAELTEEKEKELTGLYKIWEETDEALSVAEEEMQKL